MEFSLITGVGQLLAGGFLGAVSIHLITHATTKKRVSELEKEVEASLIECMQWEALFDTKVQSEVDKRFQEDRRGELKTGFPECDPLTQEVSKEFYGGMERYLQGYDRPSHESPSPRILGWAAAQQMDTVRKRYLQIAKDTFVDTKPQV